MKYLWSVFIIKYDCKSGESLDFLWSLILSVHSVRGFAKWIIFFYIKKGNRDPVSLRSEPEAAARVGALWLALRLVSVQRDGVSCVKSFLHLCIKLVCAQHQRSRGSSAWYCSQPSVPWSYCRAFLCFCFLVRTSADRSDQTGSGCEARPEKQTRRHSSDRKKHKKLCGDLVQREIIIMF